MLLRVLGWATWQLLWLIVAFIVFVNLFSEYGAYPDHKIGGVGALVLLLLALVIGTWVPLRQWRAEKK